MEQKIKEEVKQQIAEMVANGLPAGVGESSSVRVRQWN